MFQKLKGKEVFFQIVLHLMVFLFYTIEKKDTSIEIHEVFFFLNYALTAFVINFYGLPRFYKNRNIYQFLLFIAVCILGSILIEELVLEQIFFSGNRAQSIKMFLAALTIIPIVTILVGFKFGWDAIVLQKQMDELKETAKQSELQFLKSQINPHFLFNNLNNLYAYALEGSKKTPQIILELAGLLRYMLYECTEERVPLSKEIQQLENFINLNELQIEERGEVTFNATGIQGNFTIAPLLLIVFVENAFKHSMSSQSDQIKIAINIELKENGQLNFTCQNNYQEISNNDKLSKGIGLENVKKRLELLYGKDYQLNIQPGKGNYKVALSLQLNPRSI